MATSSDEKIWIILSHLSLLLGIGILLPLIVFLCKKDQHPETAVHAKEALNFHISLLLYSLACIPLAFFCIGIPLIMALSLAGIILSIVAAIKASEGTFYTYPLTLRLVP